MNVTSIVMVADGTNVPCVMGADGVTVLCVVEMGISLSETEQKKLVQVVKERRFSNVAIVNEDNANVMHVSERGEKDISEDNSFLFRGQSAEISPGQHWIKRRLSDNIYFSVE